MSTVFRMTVCVLWLLCISNAAGQTNAADLYWKVNVDFQKFSQEAWQDVSETAMDDPAAPVPIQVQQMVQLLSSARNRILRATHLRHCDFLLGESIGPNSFVRHQSLVGYSGNLLLVDTKLRIQRGDYDGAVQSLVGILGLASHLQGDGLIQSSLRTGEMTYRCVNWINYLSQIGVLDPSRAARLLEAIDRLDPVDPTGVCKAEAKNINMIVAWTKKNYEEGEFDTVQQFLSRSGVNDLDLKSVTPDQFHDALDRGAVAMNSMVKVMETSDDPEAQKDQFQASFDSLNKDDLASKLFSWAKAALEVGVRQLSNMRTLVAERRAFLDNISQGRHTLNDMANAAFWYARGTKAILEIPEDAWSLLIQGKPKADQVANVEGRWREQLDSALREFREGSNIKNCDWSVLRRAVDGWSDSIHIAPAYIAGIWRAVEYLNAMSMRESPAKDNPSSTADVATAVRLVAHLAGDNVLASSCAAHELIRKLKPSVERIASNDQLPHDDFERIRAVVWLLQPEDPCGYLRSGQGTRQDLANFFAEKFPGVKVASDPALDMGSFVWTLQAGQLVSELMLADMSAKEAEVGTSPNWFAGHTAPVSRDLFVQIVGAKNWEESKNFATMELALLKNAAGKEPLKIEPPLALDVAARYKQAPEEVQQLRSLLSQRQEKQAGQSVPMAEKTVEK